ncbi:DUF5110 domain-containing protein [Aestuariicella hydrocarbonica]|uniref:DUF5110 domain-containing protein n=1 Tax=Pseudomaricurvus hydrocarbonicus TaxID=1470433 RepID=A0A9E5MNW5_9GAMM|nr:TIM-barrel domain-containing protein [Aestuariicella hydrocarbonica]NHO67642.1 DUF5110 domain-containing protein [Aestuariicella hydrocarbonica]
MKTEGLGFIERRAEVNNLGDVNIFADVNSPATLQRSRNRKKTGALTSLRRLSFGLIILSLFTGLCRGEVALDEQSLDTNPPAAKRYADTTFSDQQYDHLLDYRVTDEGLRLQTAQQQIDLRFYGTAVVEVHYLAEQETVLPSFAIDPAVAADTRLTPSVIEHDDFLSVATDELTVVIDKQPLRLRFYRQQNLLLQQAQDGFWRNPQSRGFRFELSPGEKLLGAGERVLGMNRRGHRLPLYNRAHYGYETYSEQMYFSLPLLWSDKKYGILFDNPARGVVDIGKTDADRLTFEAVGGRSSYVVFAGDSYAQLLRQYVSLTGRQPLPPRWVFGSFASRFGYHSEAEVRDVVRRYRQQDFPLDAVVLDLFWFGPDIKGHMGNLDWDRQAFPTPEKMMADLQQQGVQTVLITEPFVLSSSRRWPEAVAQEVLSKNAEGQPQRFDFYFGNTGLIDVFDARAQDWFWNIYAGLIEQGVAGLWGDLGEPEVHPDDTRHALGRGGELHNAYGHQWARMLFERHEKAYPQRRPMLMMRSGFAGSQRYGMIPWTGDVSRSWGGLQAQVELMLQMGMQGLGYIHSDAGGFAGGETFDPELYRRWLQFATFQPIFRPHGQEHIPSEPVFHDRETQAIVRRFIKLRYRLLPYLYTMAWQNSVTGMPLARPLFMNAQGDSEARLFADTQAYLWGDAFLVAPVVRAGVTEKTVYLPEGTWFDFWNDQRQQGGATVTAALSPETLPLWVRAGSFVPMLSEDIATTRDYSSAALTLHYYADASVPQAQAQMYDDDGSTHRAFAQQQYELLQFSARQQGDALQLQLSREGFAYAGRPDQRQLTLVIHHWLQSPQRLSVNGQKIKPQQFSYDQQQQRLTLTLPWRGDESLLIAVD